MTDRPEQYSHANGSDIIAITMNRKLKCLLQLFIYSLARFWSSIVFIPLNSFPSLAPYISLYASLCVFAVRLQFGTPFLLSPITYLPISVLGFPLSENFHSAFKNIFLSFRTSLPDCTSLVVVYFHISRQEFEYTIRFFCIHHCRQPLYRKFMSETMLNLHLLIYFSNNGTQCFLSLTAVFLTRFFAICAPSIRATLQLFRLRRCLQNKQFSWRYFFLRQRNAKSTHRNVFSGIPNFHFYFARDFAFRLRN